MNTIAEGEPLEEELLELWIKIFLTIVSFEILVLYQIVIFLKERKKVSMFQWRRDSDWNYYLFSPNLDRIIHKSMIADDNDI